MENCDHQLGRVVSVGGSEVIFLLDSPPCEDGTATDNALSKGTLVKIEKGHSWAFASVAAVSIPLPHREKHESDMILAELVLLGEVKKPVNGAGLALFERGVSFFPAVGDRVFLASTEDLSIVYARPNSPSIRIGTIVQNTSIPAYIAPDNLLSKHFAILGTTGTGKSCATALILHRILRGPRERPCLAHRSSQRIRQSVRGPRGNDRFLLAPVALLDVQLRGVCGNHPRSGFTL